MKSGDKKCALSGEHLGLVSLATKVKPHIWACTVCYDYAPKPHPALTEEEVFALIGFVKAASSDFKKKLDHVRKAKQTRKHHCHWQGCMKQVPPAMWGCKEHWFRLPKNLRDRIWATYRTGQEESGTPSQAYIHVSKQVQEWIEAQELL